MQRFKRRIETLKRTIELKKEEDAEDIDSWELLLNLFNELGDEGMSSDESDVDNTGLPIFYVKKMPWRPNLEKEIQLVDHQRIADKSLFSKKGAKPVQRVRISRRGESRRDPYQGRPKALYEKLWLAEQTDEMKHKLEISKTKFKLPRIL